MSTPPIIVKIVDQVDPQIAAKITGIGTAARQSATDLQALQSALASLSTGASGLNVNLGKLPATLNTATQSTGRFTGSLAQLFGRVVGMEAGFGMLGGAISRVGVAAGVAGPLIIAALAVGAVVGAILIYDKFEEAARKLVIAQATLENHIGSQNDKLLVLNETLIKLTQGPLAAYKKELEDLPHKTIITDVDQLLAVLDKQKSKWDSLVSAVQRYIVVVAGLPNAGPIQPKFDLQNAEDFINQIQQLRADSNATGNGLQGLNNALKITGEQLVALHNIEQDQNGQTLTNTEKARRSIQSYYDALVLDLKVYQATRKNLVAGANGDLLSEQRKLAQEQLRLFNDELSQIKAKEGTITAQEVLALRQAQLAGTPRSTAAPGTLGAQPALPLNKATIDRYIGNAQEAIDRQNKSLQELTERYRLQIEAGGAYSDELKIENEQHKAALQLTRQSIPLTQANIGPINDLIRASVESARVDKTKIELYKQFNEPLLEYNAALTASAELVKAGAISQDQATVANNVALRTYKDAIDPLNQYNIGLEHEIGLLGQYGKELEIATEIDRVRQDLQQRGYDLDQTQIALLRQRLELLRQERQIQQDMNQLWEQNAGALEKLNNYQTALNTALQKGVITEQQYKIATAQTNVAIADQINKQDKQVTITSQLKAGIGKYIADFQGLGKGISDVYGQVFSTIADGAANSLGRAIVYAEDLGSALKDVARTALSELISGFIKLGLQWLITEIIGETIGKAAAAATVATATVTAVAWAPAAALASLATLGTNAAPAAAAIAGVTALTEAIAASSALHLYSGGLVNGPSGVDRVPAMLTAGEYVVNAGATSKHFALLDAINSGAKSVNANSGPGAVGPSKMNIQIIRDMRTNIDVQDDGEGRIRIIARQEAKQSVFSYAPQVIASDMRNPNSRTSKAMRDNVVAPRKR